MPKINTYTDNASIENDDKLLTYDTQGAATKLTAFSTIWTWIQNKFNALTKQTDIGSTDQLLMVKNGNITGRIDYNVLAKAIIEQYAGSTLGGSAQSVKAAITALNSKHIRISWGTTVTFDLGSNQRYVAFIASDCIYSGINYSDRLTCTVVVPGTDGVEVSASRDGMTVTLQVNRPCNICVLRF